MTDQHSDQPDILKICCRALDDKKAENLRVLDVRGISSITDYFVLASGTSRPHLRALTNEAARAFKEHHIRVLGKEAGDDSDWNVLDAFDIIVHLFLPETRDHYRLDSLWKDAGEVPLDSLLGVESR